MSKRDDINSILNKPGELKFKTNFHRIYYNQIKDEMGTLPSDDQIDKNRWYYDKYMEPYYSDKIIHLYSKGKIGRGYSLMCVYCKSRGHVKSRCPIAKKNGLGFTHNF